MTLQISSVKHCMPKCQSQLAPKLMRTAAIGLCFLSCNASCGDEERDLVDCLNDDALTAESGIGNWFRRVFPSTTKPFCFLPSNASCDDEKEPLVDCLNTNAVTAESGIGNPCRKASGKKTKASSKLNVGYGSFDQNQRRSSITQHPQEIFGFEDVKGFVCGTPIQDAALFQSQLSRMQDFVRSNREDAASLEKFLDILYQGVEEGNLREALKLSERLFGWFAWTVTGIKAIEKRLDWMLKSTSEDIDRDAHTMYKIINSAAGREGRADVELLEGPVSNCRQKIKKLHEKCSNDYTRVFLESIDQIFDNLLTVARRPIV